eukprot:ANDGO_04207.mRNA.1 Dynein assembly factor 1
MGCCGGGASATEPGAFEAFYSKVCESHGVRTNQSVLKAIRRCQNPKQQLPSRLILTQARLSDQDVSFVFEALHELLLSFSSLFEEQKNDVEHDSLPFGFAQKIEMIDVSRNVLTDGIAPAVVLYITTPLAKREMAAANPFAIPEITICEVKKLTQEGARQFIAAFRKSCFVKNLTLDDVFSSLANTITDSKNATPVADEDGSSAGVSVDSINPELSPSKPGGRVSPTLDSEEESAIPVATVTLNLASLKIGSAATQPSSLNVSDSALATSSGTSSSRQSQKSLSSRSSQSTSEDGFAEVSPDKQAVLLSATDIQSLSLDELLHWRSNLGRLATISLDLSNRHFSSADISHVYLSKYLVVLDLSKNALEYDSLARCTLPTGLRYLNVSDNRLSSLYGLSGLSDLRVLIASRNSLERIEEGVFDGNPLLEHLDLSYNRLKVVQNVEHLSFLSFLDLACNQLANRQAIRTLSLLRSLHQLVVQGNPIQRESYYRSYVLNTLFSGGVVRLSLLDGEHVGSLGSASPSSQSNSRNATPETSPTNASRTNDKKATKKFVEAKKLMDAIRDKSKSSPGHADGLHSSSPSTSPTSASNSAAKKWGLNSPRSQDLMMIPPEAEEAARRPLPIQLDRYTQRKRRQDSSASMAPKQILDDDEYSNSSAGAGGSARSPASIQHSQSMYVASTAKRTPGEIALQRQNSSASVSRKSPHSGAPSLVRSNTSPPKRSPSAQPSAKSKSTRSPGQQLSEVELETPRISPPKMTRLDSRSSMKSSSAASVTTSSRTPGSRAGSPPKASPTLSIPEDAKGLPDFLPLLVVDRYRQGLADPSDGQSHRYDIRWDLMEDAIALLEDEIRTSQLALRYACQLSDARFSPDSTQNMSITKSSSRGSLNLTRRTLSIQEQKAWSDLHSMLDQCALFVPYEMPSFFKEFREGKVHIDDLSPLSDEQEQQLHYFVDLVEKIEQTRSMLRRIYSVMGEDGDQGSENQWNSLRSEIVSDVLRDYA